jgi:hypothetical protein
VGGTLPAPRVWRVGGDSGLVDGDGCGGGGDGSGEGGGGGGAVERHS